MKAISWLCLLAAMIAAAIGVISDLVDDDHSFWAALAGLGAVVGAVAACLAHHNFLEDRDWNPVGALPVSFLVFAGVTAATTFLSLIVIVVGVLWLMSKAGGENQVGRTTRGMTIYRTTCNSCGYQVSSSDVRCPNGHLL